MSESNQAQPEDVQATSAIRAAKRGKQQKAYRKSHTKAIGALLMILGGLLVAICALLCGHLLYQHQHLAFMRDEGIAEDAGLAEGKQALWDLDLEAPVETRIAIGYSYYNDEQDLVSIKQGVTLASDQAIEVAKRVRDQGGIRLYYTVPVYIHPDDYSEVVVAPGIEHVMDRHLRGAMFLGAGVLLGLIIVGFGGLRLRKAARLKPQVIRRAPKSEALALKSNDPPLKADASAEEEPQVEDKDERAVKGQDDEAEA